MAHYLLAVQQPDGPRPDDAFMEPILRDLTKVNEEMAAAGVWVFAMGLSDATNATVLKLSDGEVLATDGPYIEGKEHLGGFTVIDVADLDAALHWGRKLAAAITLPIEVRAAAHVEQPHC